MSISKLNILKSYITEVFIDSEPSAYSGMLEVYLSKGRLQLCSPHAIYSYGDKYDNFTDSFARMNLSGIRDVLLLGFGLGSIPFMLEKVFDKQFDYTGVEIDPAVIKLATRHVMRDLRSSIQLVEADAAVFVQVDTGSYDLICIDLFLDTVIPSPFLENEFLLDVMDLLRKGGRVMFNHLYLTDHDRKSAQEYYEKIFAPTVQKPTLFELRTNAMLIGNK